MNPFRGPIRTSGGEGPPTNNAKGHTPSPDIVRGGGGGSIDVDDELHATVTLPSLMHLRDSEHTLSRCFRRRLR